MGGGVGGKDVFSGFSSAKNTMFLRLFRSNGKEGTLSTDQLMRPGSLLQSRQSFSTGPEGGERCAEPRSPGSGSLAPHPKRAPDRLFCGGEKPKGRCANQPCLFCSFRHAPLYPGCCLLQDCPPRVLPNRTLSLGTSQPSHKPDILPCAARVQLSPSFPGCPVGGVQASPLHQGS